MKIIAFGGLIGAGKTTAADFVELQCHRVGKKVTRQPFARFLKSAAQVCGMSKHEHPEVYRYFCQTIGAYARSIDPDWWVNLWSASIAVWESKGNTDTICLVDDFRFPNELELLRQKGAKLFFIQRDDLPFDKSYNHESEAFARNFDPAEYTDIKVIVNNGNLDEFKKTIFQQVLCEVLI